jgi:outer membrane lipoprotein carrier protein
MNMKWTTASFLLSASLLAASPPKGPKAASDSVQAALSRLEKAEKNVSSLRFSFTQKTHIKVTDEDQTIRGKALFLRPAKFRVEHISPRVQTVVSDGKTLWFYNPERNQVLSDKWENWSRSAGFPQGLTPFQEGASSFQERYEITHGGREGASDVLHLTPKKAGAWPYTLRLWVDDRGLPVRTELESQTLKTSTEVDEIEVNPVLEDSQFTFTPPAGADVIGAPDAEGKKK